MIDRRAFLRRLGFGTVAAAAAASGVLDIERLLWVPGEKTIFIPEVAAVIETALHGNTFVTADWMVRETLRIYENQMTVLKLFNRKWAA